ncbi:hypothetical protein V8F20_003871 [Naviculisporaceae sp. PSN 640]
MAPERRNEFLDAGDSDDDVGAGYNSEDDFQKGGGRSTKRRRVDSDDEDDFSDIDNSDAGSEGGAKINPDADQDQDGENEDENNHDEASSSTKPSKKSKQKSSEITLPSHAKPLTKKNLVSTAAAIKKSGVVYLSRIPPFMKPAKVRSLLEPYGKINRMFLAPEDPAVHAKRVRLGGNKKKSYTEGWIEFVSKKDAKKVCELLNATTIGGKKGGYYRDDLWNLLYLKGFKWNNLTEQIAAENAERQSRMRAEISKSTKENKEFVRNLEKAKVLDGIQAKNEAKKRKKGDIEEDAGKEQAQDVNKRRATFKQVPLAKKRKADGDAPELVQRTASKLLG